MGSGARPAAEGCIEVNLIEDIDQTLTATPTLWWLGRAGFVVRFANITFYVDPWLSQPGALVRGLGDSQRRYDPGHACASGPSWMRLR